MGFLDSRKEIKNDVPFSKKAKSEETKVVKINADLHYKLNLYKAKKGGGVTITDLINQAVSEFIQNNSDIEETLKNK